MRQLIAYHLATILPMMIIMQLFMFDYIGWYNFTGMFMLYFFVYRPIMDYKRLKSKGLVDRKAFLKSWGFVRFKFVDELMFKK
ncbi:hypothetical protein [Echinicola vietnamensis]|uniref:Uncharacterized protein n=1 Tax=Echinicola vietnamensis (strain DSM 17526 / LMG 23754 / KMM 6221) TaxID=926556 RepID=L0FVQ4_ECHVK|nr:hypothetical protein [Echinicola vietnamensis]AGA76841.1 hypothetical protein Echvi_0563 [Echinicola vietnamensis DSM 17526]